MIEVDDSLRKLTADLRQAPGKVGRDARQVIEDTARRVQETARSLVPVDSGALRDSITQEVMGDGRNRTIRANVGAEVEYGRFVEYGTARTAPRPFMAPALDAHRERFESDLSAAMRDLL